MAETQRFGRFELRPAQRLLLVDGVAAPVTPRAFDLLLALAAHPQRVVTKDELMDAVWPGLVVEENNLAVHVAALRKLLGPKAIATVPGRGYQLVAFGTEGAEAPPPSPSLPAGELVGRDADLADLARALRAARWVTVIGAGGVGKTALARAALRELAPQPRDGVAWIDLTPVHDPALVAGTVAQALGLPLQDGAQALPALVQSLAPRQMLLALDGAEHLLGAVAELGEALLAGAPDLALLVTSQAACRAEGETVFRLEPLPVPVAGTDPRTAIDSGAVAMFLAQARAADRRFAIDDAALDTVIAVCRQLEGLPLAIKLAAARLPLLGLAGLADRLHDGLGLLRGPGRTSPPRQQAMLSALAWSHGLLAPAPRKVLRRLSVFAGGFPLDAVAAVAGDPSLDDWAVVDALGELVDRSLVAVDSLDGPRYRLPGVVAEYARERLDEAQERPGTQRRHAESIAAMAERAYEAYWRTPDAAWLQATAPDIDNIRAALAWARVSDPALARRLAASTAPLFMLLGLAAEARRGLDEEPPADSGAPEARYWLERSRLHWDVDRATMLRDAGIAEAVARRAGDAQSLYLALRCVAACAEPAQGQAAVDEMARLEQPGWPARMRTQRLLAALAVALSQGRADEACAVGEALLALARREGLDAVAAAARLGLARATLCAGHAESALGWARSLHDDPAARRGNFALHALGTAAEALLAVGQVDAARERLVAFMGQARVRELEWFDRYAGVFAWLAACDGDAARAARLLGYADKVGQRAGVQDPHAAVVRERTLVSIGESLAPAAGERCRQQGLLLDRAAAEALALAPA